MLLRQFAPIKKNPLELIDIPTPEPNEEEILIKINVCGVCHTDLHTVEGELPDVMLPVVPGHQVVGKIAKSGSRVFRFKEGDRVGAAWLYSTDGTCRFCRNNKENLCENGRFTGYSRHGGYAEYMVIPEKFAYAIPASFEDTEAAPLLCAGIIGYRALRLSGIRPGQRLGLLGFGASAHVAIQVAMHWGCEVYVFSRSQEHLVLARKLGAVWTGSSKEKPPHKLDGLINFTPAGPTVLDGMRHLEKGGTQTLTGIFMSPIPQMEYSQNLYFERRLGSVANATRQDGEELLKIASEIPIRTSTSTFPLEDANKVLRYLKESRIDGAAVLRIDGRS